jgi:hypothetical protein
VLDDTPELWFGGMVLRHYETKLFLLNVSVRDTGPFNFAMSRTAVLVLLKMCMHLEFEN